MPMMASNSSCLKPIKHVLPCTASIFPILLIKRCWLPAISLLILIASSETIQCPWQKMHLYFSAKCSGNNASLEMPTHHETWCISYLNKECFFHEFPCLRRFAARNSKQVQRFCRTAASNFEGLKLFGVSSVCISKYGSAHTHCYFHSYIVYKQYLNHQKSNTYQFPV